VRARRQRLRQSVRSGFWAVPSACVAGAVLFALALVQLDHHLQTSYRFTFGAGPDGAREVLSAITTAMITFTGLVFSITVVVLQLTSSQFSPRVLRTFLRDRQTQFALGAFTATFVYSLMVLRTVNAGDGDKFVPAFATTAALLLLLVTVGLFVSYIHHISTSVQASSIIGAIGSETREALDRRYPPGRAQPIDTAGVLPPDDLPALVLPAMRSGVITYVDDQRLVALAGRSDVVLRSRVRLGDYVPEGAPLLDVLGEPEDLNLEAVHDAVTQARDRTLPSAYASSSTSRSGPCRPASTTPRRPCSAWTSCTTCCAGWQPARCAPACTPTTTGGCAWYCRRSGSRTTSPSRWTASIATAQTCVRCRSGSPRCSPTSRPRHWRSTATPYAVGASTTRGGVRWAEAAAAWSRGRGAAGPPTWCRLRDGAAGDVR